MKYKSIIIITKIKSVWSILYEKSLNSTGKLNLI